MARILFVVMNSVTFDARVQREASSLQAAGHDVQIVGLRRQPDDARTEVLADGVRVVRLGAPSSGGRTVRRRAASDRPAADRVHYDELEPPFPETRRGQRSGDVAAMPFLLRHSGAPLSIAWSHLRRETRDRRFAAALRRSAYDVVHAHDAGALALGARLARAHDVPLIFDAHEIYDQDNSSRRHRAKSEREAHTIARLAHQISGFIAVNDSNKAYYAEHFPRLPEAVTLPNASRRLTDVVDDGRLHAACGWPPDTRVLLYQGALNSARCLPQLARSVARLPEGWAVACVGPGPLRGALQEIRRELSPDRQRWLAVLEPVPAAELPSWTAGATLGSIALEPGSVNHWFASPNRLWSYPQVGVPFLASAFPELERVVERYGCGWLLPFPVTPESFSDVVASLSDDALARARDGCAAFMRAESWEQHEPKLLALYARVLEAGPRRVPQP